MKNRIRILIITILTLAGSDHIFATDNSNATTVSTIVPLVIAKVGDMSFRNIAIPASASGTIVLTPTGTCFVSGAGGVTLPATGTVAAASFIVSGQADYIYGITLPVSCTISSSSDTMTVNAFTSNPDITGTLSGTGSQTLTVGASLNIPPGVKSGVYTNATDVSVIVNYN